MPAVKHVVRVVLLLSLVAGSLLACNLLPSISYNGTPVISPSPAPSENTPSLNTWKTISTGVEIRTENWKSAGNNEDVVTILRLDLKHVHLRVKYEPEQPPTLGEWMKQTKALAVINGGYFDEKNRPTGLLISDGNAVGASYSGFGGMLAVDAQGKVSLRSLRDHPYSPDNEQVQQATQSSPMLVMGGKRTDFNANAASQRRTVVAMDKQGRLLFIVSPGQAFSLDELADLLASSDLSIQTALNLDGGASTGLEVDTKAQDVSIDAFTPLPIAIIVT